MNKSSSPKEPALREEKINQLAGQVLSLSKDSILVSLRFLDGALAGLKPVVRKGMGCMATDGAALYYDPVYVLKEYQEEPKRVTRCYLHMLMHCIFYHSFQYDKVEAGWWDLAADIAVESTIMELRLPAVTLPSDGNGEGKLSVLKEDAGGLTAEKLYRYFKHNPPSAGEQQELNRLFQRDVHTLWKPREELLVTREQWKKISERIKADLKSFSRAKAGAESLTKNLEEATRDRYDYSQILKRFTVMGEDVTVNDEEFDYIYYTYGLEHYGNLPLIEPLEYREAVKVKEFVIAIDTSASCRGPLVRAFLNKTYSILKSTENFFHRINVHIIQCDNEVQNDTKISSDEEFEAFMKYGKLTGFGATDFRPVFDHVAALKERGEFENLKGLIYFTDGYGIYPERMPDYDVIFAFLNEDENRGPVPPWSLKVILEEDELEEEEQKEGGPIFREGSDKQEVTR